MWEFTSTQLQFNGFFPKLHRSIWLPGEVMCINQYKLHGNGSTASSVLMQCETDGYPCPESQRRL
jgi:hypothetical protein